MIGRVPFGNRLNTYRTTEVNDSFPDMIKIFLSDFKLSKKSPRTARACNVTWA